MKKIVITVILCLVMVNVAFANTVRQDCGCGLGGIAIGDKEGLLWNLLGTFLNGMCGNQTFAMSSGTSDCGVPERLAILDQMNIFVADNMDALAVDIAQGNGDSLDALAEIATIQNPNARHSIAPCRTISVRFIPTPTSAMTRWWLKFQRSWKRSDSEKNCRI